MTVWTYLHGCSSARARSGEGNSGHDYAFAEESRDAEDVGGAGTVG